MKRISILTSLLIVMVICISEALLAQESPRSRESFNQGWKFVKYFKK